MPGKRKPGVAAPASDRWSRAARLPVTVASWDEGESGRMEQSCTERRTNSPEAVSGWFPKAPFRVIIRIAHLRHVCVQETESDANSSSEI